VAYSTVFPLVQVGIVAESWGGGYGRAAWAAAATAGLLSLHLVHVAHAVRGTRPRAGAWGVVAMAGIILAALPHVGSLWLPISYIVILSALIVGPPRWSLVVAVVVVVAQFPLASWLGSELPAAGSYYALTAVWRASAVFVPLWLVGAVRELRAARQALADEAVVRERVRIDSDVRSSLGAALDTIVTRGQRAGHLVGRDDAAVEPELRDLVDGSRRALSAARQLITGYRRSTLQTEVDTAAGLLAAAGFHTRVDLPQGRLPDTVDEAVRSTLRSDTARLLRDEAARDRTVTVTVEAGQVRLVVRPEGAAPSSAGVGR
jgi:signal transduction histidine kinase